MAKTTLLLLSFLSLCCALPAQFLPCDGRLMVIDGGLGANVYPIVIDRQNGTSTTGAPIVELAPPLSNWGPDAYGYRWKDSTFYGTVINHAFASARLFAIKLNGDFSVADVTSPELESGFRIFAGCVSNDQRHLIVVENRHVPPTEGVGYDPALPNLLHKINLETGNYEFDETLLLHGTADSDTIGIIATDIAIDPITGLAYAIDGFTNRMVTIDLETGEVDNERYPRIDFSDDWPARGLFFDGFNRLYGIGRFHLVEFDKSTGAIARTYPFTAPSATARFDDGCSCPMTVALEKELRAEQLRQCQTTEAVIRVAFLNEAALGPASFRDSFPPGVAIEAVLYNPYGGEVTGIGTNVLSIDKLQPIFGVDSIVLRLSIGAQVSAGGYLCQASLHDLDFSSFGDSRTSVYSDYPPSPAYNDPTPFTVAELSELSPELSFQLCTGEALSLRPLEHTQGLGFLWEDGSTADSLVVSSPGTYGLSIDTGCEVLAFTVEVTESTLSVSLGEDLRLLFGQSVTLSPAVQGSSPAVAYAWSSSDTAALSCLDCPAVEAAPVQTATSVSVQVTSEDGCTAEDRMDITVERPVYAPTAFSPNGDGRNDRFLLFTPSSVGVAYVRVYDRWGGLVFEQSGGTTNVSAHGWAGEVGSKAAPPGLYTWTAKLLYADGQAQALAGEVNLVR